MARIARLVNGFEPTVYHVMSRTALDGFPLEEIEKDYLVGLLRTFGQLYFVDILGFCVMGNHFHLLVRMYPGDSYSDDAIKAKVENFYQGKKHIIKDEIAKYRAKLGNLSEFVKEIKQGFTRYYNKEKKRRGFFWGQRYKSVIVENGETLINCLAYIDLNPVRATIVEKPEDYRWCTLGYLVQSGNQKNLLSLEFGLPDQENLSVKEKIQMYREFVYHKGVIATDKGAAIKKEVMASQKNKKFELTAVDRFRYRTRYFTDSGVIGSKKFVTENYHRFQELFNCKNAKKPVPIKGLGGVFSLKRLAIDG